MRTDPLGPVHPGEILREEVLEPLAMNPYALAAQLRVPRTRIERLVREETPSRRTRLCGWRATWAPRPSSGCACRRATTRNGTAKAQQGHRRNQTAQDCLTHEEEHVELGERHHIRPLERPWPGWRRRHSYLRARSGSRARSDGGATAAPTLCGVPACAPPRDGGSARRRAGAVVSGAQKRDRR